MQYTSQLDAFLAGFFPMEGSWNDVCRIKVKVRLDLVKKNAE